MDIFQNRKITTIASVFVLLGIAAYGQTASLEGDVKDAKGQPLQGALVKIVRTDIKGSYKVKTDKKGHYFHAGLPLGTYTITLEVDGKDVDEIKGVRTRLGDPITNNFSLKDKAAEQQALQKAAETGTLTKEQARDMSPETKAALEKQMKERSAALAKNKELNDAFNVGKDALAAKQYDVAIQSLTKATTLDPNQHVVWASLADAYTAAGAAKAGEEQTALYMKGIEAWDKALALKADDAAYHNNYALLLARVKKTPEAQAELNKAAQLDPTQSGKFYYNLGAVLVNTGQIDASGEAFKKAIDTDPNYADAQYQYGMYLMSKAQTTPDGKFIPPPGTIEAFQKYIELRPDGANAQTAKDMLTAVGSGITTKYENPDAKKGKAVKKK